MELRQKTELRKLLIPALAQSLNILALPLLDVKQIVEHELENNPLLDELPALEVPKDDYPIKSASNATDDTLEYRLSLISNKISLQDMLLRQLGMFTENDRDYKIGEEIIGNIDDNGYLKVDLVSISLKQSAPLEQVEHLLSLIQQFEPAGVAARSLSECLLIQLNALSDDNPLLRKIIEYHLGDLAKKNYSVIAKHLNEPIEKIKPLIDKIHKFNPKPGRNFSTEEIQRVIPDVIVDLNKDNDIIIIINNEDIPNIGINKEYQKMLKGQLDLGTKQFLSDKLKQATDLMRSISRRQTTLRGIVEVVFEIQEDALKEGLDHLKPLTFSQVAERIQMHETTVCRAIMNKYVKTPYGVVSLKHFFSSGINNQDGRSISSHQIKNTIKEKIEQEDKRDPLSDQDIVAIITKEQSLNISRRTVTKYREALKIPSSPFRKER